MRNAITVVIGAFVCAATVPGLAVGQSAFEARFEKSIHESMTRQVLGKYVQMGVISQADVDRVTYANLGQDDHQSHNEYHFDNCNFTSGATFINNRWAEVTRIGNRRAAASLQALGKLLHATQDFYSHSTWVELKAGYAPIPLWNFSTSTLPAGIVTGTWVLGERRCPNGTPSHGTLNKDSSTSERGLMRPPSGPNRTTPYFNLAFDCALRSSGEQVSRYFGFAASPDQAQVGLPKH